MSQGIKSERFQANVAEAEAATAKVSDPELRKIAFGKILDQLLGASSDRAPELNVVRTKTTKDEAGPRVVKRSGPAAYLDELVDEDFFSKPKSLGDVRTELANRGHHIPSTSLSGPLQSLCKSKRLRRNKGASESGKEGYVYSNW